MNKREALRMAKRVAETTGVIEKVIMSKVVLLESGTTLDDVDCVMFRYMGIGYQAYEKNNNATCEVYKFASDLPEEQRAEAEENNTPVELPELTALEIKFVNAMRNNEYNDALQDYPCGTWTFAAANNSGMTEKVARGVISSLVQKSLIKSQENLGYDSEVEPSVVDFTEFGTHLFDNANGKECSWGGARLLEEKEEPKKATKKMVTMKAFTGMIIGEFEVIKTTKKYVDVLAKKGTLRFDRETGIQIDVKNPKFANRIAF